MTAANMLLQRYNTVAITPASIAHLADTPDVSNLTAVGMGISQKFEDGLPPLPSVAAELQQVIQNGEVAVTKHGALPGTILLNGDFTEKAMENLLDRQVAVVHIASHFVFKPGDDSQSYLLLAGKDQDKAGFHLTVADFRDDQKHLAGGNAIADALCLRDGHERHGRQWQRDRRPGNDCAIEGSEGGDLVAMGGE